MPLGPHGRYLASTAVLLNEILKLLLCLGVALRDRRKVDATFSTSLRNLYSELIRSDSWKLAIPACLYTLQNRLQYVAVSNLDAATFQVTYQLKILTTALFSVTMLGRRLSALKWISLLTLTAGVAIVQLPAGSGHQKRSGGFDGGSEVDGMDRNKGLLAVIVACMLSGLAGVYFEKVLKGSSTTLWIRNIQLSFWSIIPALFVGVLWMDGTEIAERGFFVGYNGVVWMAICFQAFGGIIVALCVNYADNIAKNFATSISIIISCVASVWFFEFVVTINFIIGAIIVLFATWLYSKPDAPPAKETQYIPLQQTVIDDDDEEKFRRNNDAAKRDA
ncbi:nucleotide-sugar transporter-domain-containing protein [Pyronema omphalodes]|nr:nucleotide-sugar transporter-domain-containing protein [Pyronema omphalodes]